METDRLRYFCVIAETGSLTAAAQILNVSHSGLSKAMSVLQSELGMQLFRPLGRGLELTESGKHVYEKSKPILASLQNLKFHKASAAAHFIKIGLAEIFAISLTGHIAKTLSEQKIGSDFYELDSGETEVQLLDGKIDFAVSFIPYPHNDLEYLKIKKIPMAVFCTNSKFEKMNLSEIPFVVPNMHLQQNPLSLKSRDGWPAEVQRNAQFGASSLASALKIVEQGVAAVFMPQFLGRSKYIEIETRKKIFAESERDIFIVKKKNIEETKEMKMVAKIIRQQC